MINWVSQKFAGASQKNKNNNVDKKTRTISVMMTQSGHNSCKETPITLETGSNFYSDIEIFFVT